MNAKGNRICPIWNERLLIVYVTKQTLALTKEAHLELELR